MSPPAHPSKTWIWAAAGVIAVAGVLGAAYASYHFRGMGTRVVHARSDPASPSFKPPSTRQTAALELQYPAASAATPGSISTSYNAHKDRTRMTLELRNVAQDPPAAGVIDVIIKLSSEYVGKTRPTEHGESSVDGTVIIKCRTPGVLALASEPGKLFVDDSSLLLHPNTKSKAPYTTETQPDHVKETLAFRVHTEDLLRAATGQKVIVQFGTIRVKLTAQEVGELREFAARMNPKP